MSTQLGFYNPAALAKPFELSISALKSVLEPDSPSYSKRVPNCQKCGQHGKKSRLKGHKRVCPFKDCTCAKCQVVSERQKLMADQIKIRRRQKKDTLYMTREHLTNQFKAMAALSAAGQMPLPFGNLNALLYNQLKVPGPLLTSPTASSDGSSYSPTNAMTSFTSSPDILTSGLLLPPSPPNTSTTATSSPPISTPPSVLPQLSIATPTLPTQSFVDRLAASTTSSIIAPVAINPAVTSTAFSFPSLLSNENLLQNLLASYKLLEQQESILSATTASVTSADAQMTNSIIDVCTV